MVKRLPVAISEEEFSKLIENTKKRRDKLAFLLAFGSGLRISEIVGAKTKREEPIPPLTADKFNLKENTILLLNAKGGKDRIVPVAKGFKSDFLKLLPIKATPRTLERAFKVACKKAGLLESKSNLHFHSLRHGFATQNVKNGVPIHHVRTLLGHSNISTTNRYLEANPQEAIKSYMEKF